MELLIFCRQYYNGDSAKIGHWLDTEYQAQMAKLDFRIDLTAAQIMKEKDNVENKWRSRAIPGDIVEVHDDGWWDNTVMKKPDSRQLKCYACVKLPGVRVVKYLADREDTTDPTKFKRRNRVDSACQAGKATIETIQSVQIYDKILSKPVVLQAELIG